MSTYRSIACGLYDHLEVAAMRGRPLLVVYRDETGQRIEREAVVADVFSRDGAEWLCLEGLIRVGETTFDDSSTDGSVC
jgi:transcriptional antiterminator Rof (Rho-off)